MKSSQKAALSFLIRKQLKMHGSVRLQKRNLFIRGTEITYDIYTSHRPSLGTIVCFNGLAPLGNRDERFVELNRTLAAIGFRVLCPFFPEICDWKIGLESLYDFESFILQATEDPSLCPNGKIGIFAPSFAGGLSLIVSGKESIRTRISAVCTVGTFGTVDTILEYLLTNQENDEYGRMVLLYNFLPVSIGHRPHIMEGIRLILRDNYFHWTENQFPGYLESITPEDREFLLRLRNEPEFRIQHWKNIIESAGEQRRLLEDLAVLPNLKNLQCPIVLLHGKEDKVVPCSESLEIHSELNRLGKPSKISVTPLISHGDSGVSFLNFWDLGSVVESFSFYFDAILRSESVQQKSVPVLEDYERFPNSAGFSNAEPELTASVES